MPTVIRVSVCLNSGPGKGKAQATILVKSDSTESLLSIAANKLRLTKKDVSIAKLYVWQTGIELPRHEHWRSGIVCNDSLIAIAIRPGEVYAGPHRSDDDSDGVPSSSSSLVVDLPTIIIDLLAPPVICGVDDVGNIFTNLMELWTEQAIHRASYYTANATFWDEDGYAGSTDEEAMIGDDATTSANDVLHSLQLIDNICELHPTWILRNALDCGAGVGRVTKHVLLKRCNHVCLLEGCERWYKQIRRYLGKKRSQNCKFVLGRLEERSALEACCQGDSSSSSSRQSNNGDRRGKGEILFDLIWIQWTLQYLIDADVVSTLLRMRSALTLNGRLILKENRPCMYTVGTEESFQVDMPNGPNARYDVCRPDAHHRWLFRCALLEVEHTEHYGEISAWVLRASTDPTTEELLQPTLDAVAMAIAAKGNGQVVV